MNFKIGDIIEFRIPPKKRSYYLSGFLDVIDKYKKFKIVFIKHDGYYAIKTLTYPYLHCRVNVAMQYAYKVKPDISIF